MPTSAPPIAMRSIRLRDLIAEMMPTAMPIDSQITAAPTASEIVAGSRSKICCLTEMLFW